jgi:predicted O-linked N-acetylglucosamine transferase (SPINDLY family)
VGLQEALASYSKCLELAPSSRNAGQNRLLALNYIFEDTAAAHEEWGRDFQTQFQALPPDFDARFSNLERPLVVGYVSPDLFTHSVSYFAEAPLSHHKQSRCSLLSLHPCHGTGTSQAAKCQLLAWVLCNNSGCALWRAMRVSS